MNRLTPIQMRSMLAVLLLLAPGCFSPAEDSTFGEVVLVTRGWTVRERSSPERCVQLAPLRTAYEDGWSCLGKEDPRIVAVAVTRDAETIIYGAFSAPVRDVALLEPLADLSTAQDTFLAVVPRLDQPVRLAVTGDVSAWTIEVHPWDVQGPPYAFGPAPVAQTSTAVAH